MGDNPVHDTSGGTSNPQHGSDEQIQRELRWEAKVQRESQKGGNQLRQNDILRDELGKG